MKKILIAFSLLIGSAYADTYVNGYYKSNGTYVKPYYRTNSNNTVDDNYSTRGNRNPYTGSYGTKPRSYERNSYGGSYNSGYGNRSRSRSRSRSRNRSYGW